MTPIQKAQIVEMVKSMGDHIVLAIGDGANDVAMIQVAISFIINKSTFIILGRERRRRNYCKKIFLTIIISWTLSYHPIILNF